MLAKVPLHGENADLKRLHASHGIGADVPEPLAGRPALVHEPLQVRESSAVANRRSVGGRSPGQRASETS